MGNTTSALTLSPELVKSIFNTVRGHSSLARLCGAEPIPFKGMDVMTFSMGNEAELVGEGGNKSPGDAGFGSVTIKPFKLVYQHRLTDEFVKMSDQERIPYLEAFGSGFAAKIARGVDITAMHGLNPRTRELADSIKAKCLDAQVTNVVGYTKAAPDDNLDAAIALINAAERDMTGMAVAPSFGADMAKVKVNGVVQYPEFRFGGKPASFAGNALDMNTTVAFGGVQNDKLILGDFQNAFRWGYCETIPMEIIEYGDPDGQGDLKRKNQIVLRAEAYIGFGVIDPASFAIIRDLLPLTVASVAGTNVGDTAITVTETKGTGNIYKYYVGNAATSVIYGQDVSGGTTWDGEADITAATGKILTLVEASSTGKALKAGTVTVTAKAGG